MDSPPYWTHKNNRLKIQSTTDKQFGEKTNSTQFLKMVANMNHIAQLNSQPCGKPAACVVTTERFVPSVYVLVNLTVLLVEELVWAVTTLEPVLALQRLHFLVSQHLVPILELHNNGR